ncbi:MAG: alcohol dehydrogenase [Spirochaetaceae bacterium]|nr:MAG: alcohol dehydrogenase [Spirochaetaceae bacterium]
MLALVKTDKGPGNMQIRDVAEPQAGPEQVKIKVANTGICGSDLHIYHYDIDIPINPPVVTGHEFAGTVVEVGPGVRRFSPGDRVTSETAFSYCGTCRYCSSGFYNLCPERRTLGYWYNGAFARYTVVPEDRVHRLPDNVGFSAGAMLEPLACVTHAAIDLTTIEHEDWVLVTGPGAIGLLALQVARAQGARVIVAGSSIDHDRLRAAAQLGAERTIDVSSGDLDALVAEVTDGQGVDVVLECAGAAAAVDSGLNLIRKQGQFIQVGLFGKPISVNFEKICFKELRVSGSLGSKRSSWLAAIQLLADGQVQTDPLISHELPLTRWEEAFKLFESKSGLKLMLQPQE